MRKIEQEMIAAIRALQLGTRTDSWKNANTAVRIEGDFCTVYLHGHAIAREMADRTWTFNLCGWNTATTRARINALAREFGRPGVTTRGTWGAGYDKAGQFVQVPNKGWF